MGRPVAPAAARAAWLRPLRASLGRRWTTAGTRAGVALAAALLLGQALAVLQSLARPGELSGPDVLRLGGLAFLTFHHVALRVELPGLPGADDFPLGGASDLSVSFTVTPLLATAFVGWLLVDAGRAAAAGADGPWWLRPLHGAKPALPYAAGTFLVSVVLRLSPLAGAAGADLAGSEVTLHPSMWSALLWPLFIAAAFGAAGGLSTARHEAFGGERGAWIRGALAGGWRMTWLVVALSFLGLLVLAAVDPHATAAYFRLVASGTPLQGAAVIAFTALLAPNLATAVAAAGMGGSVAVGILGSSCSVLSYARFPRAVGNAPEVGGVLVQDACGALPVRFETAPPGYFLFLLVPVGATVLGGWLAARRSGTPVPRQGVVAGAAAGAVFALLFTAVCVLARSGSSAEGPVVALLEGGSSSLGPNLGLALLLALGWGVLGGAAGGAIHRPPAGGEPAPVETAGAQPAERDLPRGRGEGSPGP